MREATQIWRPSRNEMENMNKFNFFFVFRNSRLPRGFPFYNNAWHNLLAQTKNASVLQQPVRSEKITKSEVTTIRSITSTESILLITLRPKNAIESSDITSPSKFPLFALSYEERKGTCVSVGSDLDLETYFRSTYRACTPIPARPIFPVHEIPAYPTCWGKKRSSMEKHISPPVGNVGQVYIRGLCHIL